MISILSQHSSVIWDLRRLKIMIKRNQNVVKYLSLKYKKKNPCYNKLKETNMSISYI